MVLGPPKTAGFSVKPSRLAQRPVTRFRSRSSQVSRRKRHRDAYHLRTFSPDRPSTLDIERWHSQAVKAKRTYFWLPSMMASSPRLFDVKKEFRLLKRNPRSSPAESGTFVGRASRCLHSSLLFITSRDYSCYIKVNNRGSNEAGVQGVSPGKMHATVHGYKQQSTVTSSVHTHTHTHTHPQGRLHRFLCKTRNETDTERRYSTVV